MSDPWLDAAEACPPCPDCQPGNVIPILYGEVDSEAEFARVRGLVDFAGCIQEPDSPAFYCKTCSKRFGKVEDRDAP